MLMEDIQLLELLRIQAQRMIFGVVQNCCVGQQLTNYVLAALLGEPNVEEHR